MACNSNTLDERSSDNYTSTAVAPKGVGKTGQRSVSPASDEDGKDCDRSRDDQDDEDCAYAQSQGAGVVFHVLLREVAYHEAWIGIVEVDTVWVERRCWIHASFSDSRSSRCEHGQK